jgi:hypothetical protein
MNGTTFRLAWIGGLLMLALASPVDAQDFEQEPIEYAKRQAHDRVARLADDLQIGRVQLKHDDRLGYLPSLLAALDVPTSSQMLVFSKTSLQRHRITPRTPRAVYFNDDTYVGYCQDGDVLELSAVDDDLGAVFYTLGQDATSPPKFIRQADDCLICHASSATRHVPGHLVRSVYCDVAGLPILSSGSYRTDYKSPFKHRWGGWYVTGTHGDQLHLGNFIHRSHDNPERADYSAGQNVTDLADFCNVKPYPTPHSDLVALMVLEHQALVHNLITQANFGVRQALHYEAMLNRDLGDSEVKRWESTTSRIKSVCEPLVEGLLFCEEAELTGPIRGTSKFAEEFAERGPQDRQGRSLREFELSRRMFRYPCSYLIYSSSFRALPSEAKQYVWRRLQEVLDGRDESGKFAYLSADDRRAIREILTETHAEFRAAAPSK